MCAPDILASRHHARHAIGESQPTSDCPVTGPDIGKDPRGSTLTMCSTSAPGPTRHLLFWAAHARDCSFGRMLAQKLPARLAGCFDAQAGELLTALAQYVTLALHVGGACHDLLLADGYLGSEQLNL